jgi:hypothetical protein
MMEDVTTIDTVNKHITFARSRQVPVGSFSTDTSVTDLFLEPIRMHEIHEQRKVSFYMSFSDNLASVKTIRNGVASVKNYPMQRYFFNSAAVCISKDLVCGISARAFKHPKS